MKLLADRVLRTIRNYGMIKRGDGVLIAVSGGPDSIFMMDVLSRFKNKLGIESLSVCSLDHGLRGKESAADALFVAKRAAGLGLPFIHKKVDIRAIRRKGLSIEEAARQARYDFFRGAAAKIRATVIATGHTLDDQAETVIMRIIKGASLKGLAGIAPTRLDGNLRVIRPLIELEKAEILESLDRTGTGYRIDSSNLEETYFRNVVRSEIIPFLEKYNPRLKRSLFGLSEHLREDLQFIRDAHSKAAGRIGGTKAKGITISLKDIVLQPRAIQKEILRDCLDRSGGDLKKLSFRHWKEVQQLLSGKGKGSAVDLPGSIRALRTEREITFKKIPARKTAGL